MKIELISYRYNLKPLKRRDLTISLINDSNSDLILFSGHTIIDNKDLIQLSSKINNTKTTVFLELKNIGARDIDNWSFKINKGQLINCSTHQLFSNSKEISNNDLMAENLYNEIISRRIHKVSGKKICLLICGELNILTNIQDKSNRVKFRVNDNVLKKKFKELFDSIDIFLNPIHTPMGNQGKMHKRRVFLSKDNRVYLSTANLEKNIPEAMKAFQSSRSLQYAYFNGKDVNKIEKYNTKDYLISKIEI